jgi:hypothetical protein
LGTGDGNPAPDLQQSEAAELARITEELSRKHPNIPASEVQTLVADCAAALRRSAKVTDFIPVLVRNEVSTTLRRTAA